MANMNQRSIRKGYSKVQKRDGNKKPSAPPTNHPAHGRASNVGDPLKR